MMIFQGRGGGPPLDSSMLFICLLNFRLPDLTYNLKNDQQREEVSVWCHCCSPLDGFQLLVSIIDTSSRENLSLGFPTRSYSNQAVFSYRDFDRKFKFPFQHVAKRLFSTSEQR